MSAVSQQWFQLFFCSLGLEEWTQTPDLVSVDCVPPTRAFLRLGSCPLSVLSDEFFSVYPRRSSPPTTAMPLPTENHSNTPHLRLFFVTLAINQPRRVCRGLLFSTTALSFFSGVPPFSLEENLISACNRRTFAHLRHPPPFNPCSHHLSQHRFSPFSVVKTEDPSPVNLHHLPESSAAARTRALSDEPLRFGIFAVASFLLLNVSGSTPEDFFWCSWSLRCFAVGRWKQNRRVMPVVSAFTINFSASIAEDYLNHNLHRRSLLRRSGQSLDEAAPPVKLSRRQPFNVKLRLGQEKTSISVFLFSGETPFTIYFPPEDPCHLHYLHCGRLYLSAPPVNNKLY
ncbi:predicted protein [Arabidopsis lyrata subsp. lyrata]|uniref:Predicted protein n=1 Tax=Arabidopsis lyrata subsp. lyrata TaxID=81972 RepID=D7LT18_ARALL|nr:predicted protein [Arabidopsis lyrata subsp. lyrata]